ncbi:MAG: hypothetical protein LBG60_05665, partial [Bifidobacteriaceae bacterium]|nr:hypothetical protein [Bifidobacteriaceae bacterium]
WFLEPTEVVFTVAYKGTPLPAGTLVSVLYEAGELGGLARGCSLSQGGRFAAPALVAKVPDGRPAVVALAGTLQSDEALFRVRLAQGALSISASRQELELTLPSETLFVVSYKGTPLPSGTVVGIARDPFALGGLSASYRLGSGGGFAAPALTAVTMPTVRPIMVSKRVLRLLFRPLSTGRSPRRLP